MTTPPTPARVRHAVRALLLTPDAELLLMKVAVEGGAYVWITPGGGVEEGEAPAQALARELREETGAVLAGEGPELWVRSYPFVAAGLAWEARERFFLLPVARFTPSSAAMPAGGEREALCELRWWPLAEIERSSELFAPRRLGPMLRAILAGPPPAAPLAVGI
jgi:8-oxo-dGTP diphosphatase